MRRGAERGQQGSRLEQFEIASRTDADAIVLVTPGLGSANNTVADFTAEIAIGYAILPDNFMELIAYDATDSLINSLELTSFQHLSADMSLVVHYLVCVSVEAMGKDISFAK